MEGAGEQSHGQREGVGLLGEVRYEDIGNGRVKCLETGHELPLKMVQSYGNSKSCRLALIDRAMADKKPPLNLFEQHPTAKCKLICKLTGDTVNKTEEHIWKHISGRKFQHKLAQKEAEKESLHKGKEKYGKGSDCEKRKIKLKKHENVKISRTDSSPSADVNTSSDAEEPAFWTPPVGDRWDIDNGDDRWEVLTSSKTGLKRVTDKMGQDGSNNDAGEAHSSGYGDIGDVTIGMKRMSTAVGPSGFASKKKKSKLLNKAMENGV